MFFVAEVERADHEGIHLGAEEAEKGVFRCTDDWFAPDVEGGVDQDGASGSGIPAFQEFAEQRLCILAYGLDSSGVIDVGHGRDRGSDGFQESKTFPVGRKGFAVLGGHRGDEQHVRGGDVEFEVFGEMFLEDGWGKGAEGFPEFDFPVQDGLHLRVAWVGQDRPGAEGAWAEFHPSLEPSDNFPSLQVGDGLVKEFLFRKALVSGLEGLEDGFDF